MRFDFTGKGPVVFEGVELPESAKGLEYVSFGKEVDDDLWNWVLDLHYCWGRIRKLRSSRILRYTPQIRETIDRRREDCLAALAEDFPEAPQSELDDTIAEWHRTLDLIEQQARKTKLCRWTVEANDDDLERNLTIMIKLLRDGGAGRGPILEAPKAGMEFRIRNLPREKQLELLAMFADSFSDERTGFWGRIRRKLFGGWTHNPLAHFTRAEN